MGKTGPPHNLHTALGRMIMRRTMVALAVGAMFLASTTAAAQTTRRCFDAVGNLFLTQGETPVGAVCESLGNSKPAAKPIITKPPVAVQAPASTPGQAPAPGRQRSAEVCKARDVPALQQAIKVLRRLESATSSGIAYREYAARVTDAKVNVDEYLRESERCGVQKAIGDAMDYHVVASAAWNGIIVCPTGPDLGEDFSLKERLGLLTETEKWWGDFAKKTREIECLDKPCNACRRRAADRLRSDLATECPQYTAFLDQMEMGFAQGGLSIIWSCASRTRADAEKLLAQEGR